MNKKSKIFIAGHKGLVGKSILQKLKDDKYENLIYLDKKRLDLRNQLKVNNFFKKKKPDYVFLVAAKVGGILTNINHKAEFIYDNILIQSNVIHASYLYGVKKLIFLGSNCIYPKKINRPLKETDLIYGDFEKTNDAYAVAKVSGIKMCQSYNLQYKTNFLTLIPSSIFGSNDNFDQKNSHFLTSLINRSIKLKLRKKKKFVVWGNGEPKREVIYQEDVALACVYFMKKKVLKHDVINIGTGFELKIKDYIKLIFKMIEPKHKFKIIYDKKKPNGIKRKILNSSVANNYGWKPKFSLIDSIKKTISTYTKSLS